MAGGYWHQTPTGDGGKKFWSDRVAADPTNAYAKVATGAGPAQPLPGSDPNAKDGWGGRKNKITAYQLNKGGDVPQGISPPAGGVAPPPLGGGGRPTPSPVADQPVADPYGSESGPGIVEDWFNKRATGTDPAFDYASKRGMEALASRYGAAGLGNSGAARQGESDLMANLVSQRMGQLDSLAGAAGGEHQNRLDSMFAQGLGIAGGRSGLSSAYDTAGASSMADSFRQQLEMELGKAGVDSKAMSGIINNIMTAYGLSQKK